MTPHQTLAVAVRLFAILLALVATRELAWFYLDGRERADADVTLLSILSAAIAVAIVALLWIFPKRIASGLLPLPDDMPANPSAPNDWFAVGSSLIGLWLIADAVPALMQNLIVLYTIQFESFDTSGLKRGLLYHGGQFGLGAVLIVGANGIHKFILWVQTAGMDRYSTGTVESDTNSKPHDPQAKH